MNNVAILYHAKCLDGFGAAYAAWKKFGDSASYIPVSYGQAIPSGLEGKEVYVVDFSYPPKQMKELVDIAAEVVVIDHHKTFIESYWLGEYDGIEFEAYINYHLSGAVLAWRYFRDYAELPELLRHIQDRDLWQWKLAGTRELCAALANEKIVQRSFEYWEFLMGAFDKDDTEVMHDIYGKGRAIIAAEEVLIDECAENAALRIKFFDAPDDNDNQAYQVITCNAPYSLRDELGDRLAKQSGKIAAIYSFDGNSKLWKVSLRSVGDVDCTQLAKRFGGGGHKNAAGFSMKANEIVEWIA